ncbi:restriction endonuclease subunit S [uncultured Aliiroseovarius sp.]|uniref:restriction endonuclease subunit S n=1 Tax=uncultured Aliiroseovarius sp. TaxID=1658783 RepID=UPI0026084A6E|nr:restriction endonuclease subunit S [uncultured Aliiroseovarius sp.]
MSAVSVKLGDVVDFQTGFPFKSKDYSKDGQGLKLLRGDNIGQGFLRWETAKYWPEPLANELSQYHLKEGDVVLAMDRPWIEAGLKYSAVSKDDLPSLLVQRVARFRETEKLSAGYLRYLIGSQGFTEHVHNISTGSVVPHISGGNILEFEFELPSIETQREIAATLGVLDDKIEVNRKTAATLEEMARALYRSWFVDFDPVHAKASGRAPAHMDAATAALFPDSFDAEGLPTGWEDSTIGRELLILDSKRIPLSKAQRLERQGDIPYYGATSVMDHVDDHLFDEVLLLVGEDGSVADGEGKPFTQYIWGKSWVNNHAHVLKGKRFSVEQLKCLFDATEISAFITGAVQLKLNQGNMKKIPYVFAGEAVHSRFDELISPWFEKVRQLSEENKTLAALRDTLLPRLMSGELRVGEAREQVEAVA